MPEIRLSAADGKKFFEDSIARLMEKYADDIQRNREKGQTEETENVTRLYAPKAEENPSPQ